MKIYRPVKTDRKSQNFGDSLACALKDVRPFKIKSKVDGVCPEGYTEFYPLIGMKGHNGEDWTTWNGEPLYFSVDADTTWWSRSEIDVEGGKGVDVFSSERIYLKELPPQAGKLARREWEDNDGWVYVKFRFWHLKDVLVADARRPSPDDPKKAPNVKFGQLIGLCDSTGASSGHHLHWAMKIVADNSMTLDGDNGYTGGVDFSSHFENEFALDVLEVKQKALNAIQLANKLIAVLQAYLKNKK